MIFSLFLCIIFFGELMKNVLMILFILFIITGCGNKNLKEEEKNILSYGELICVYKAQNTSEKTIYTSSYVFNFDDTGILNGATNKETIEFYDSTKEIKDQYKNELDEVIKEYKDIEGIELKKSIENNKYSFEIIMDNNKMSDEIKEQYLLDLDRISLYKLFTKDKYTCE